MYSLESPHQCDFNEYIRFRHVIENKKHLWFVSCPGAVINTHKLKLSMSRTHFHRSKGVRAIEVLLYSDRKVSSYRSNLIETNFLPFPLLLLGAPHFLTFGTWFVLFLAMLENSNIWAETAHTRH